MTEYHAYQQRLRHTISQLPRCSKQWWSYNRQLLNKRSKTSGIPPLRDTDNTWVHDPQAKANLLATTFTSKSLLPPPPTNPPDVHDNATQQTTDPPRQSRFLLVRTRWVRKTLQNINPDKSTGPDGIPGHFLKRLANELAPPLARLIRHLLYHRHWPTIWRHHHIHPLYKRGNPSQPTNYRGIHLTTILSKTVERVIGHLFLPFLDHSNAYGLRQWAFRPRHSCRDLVTLRVLQWILSAHQNNKTSVFLSDISGAFDRVDATLLLHKYATTRIHPQLLDFLDSFFSPRTSTVIVQSQKSNPQPLHNQVFQGTVLGPPSWSIFFTDVTYTIRQHNYQESLFADDLTAERSYPKTTPNHQLYHDAQQLQTAIHHWGHNNRVIFDPSKEHTAIIHPTLGEGTNFKYLGAITDPKLSMLPEINRILSKAKPKVTAILRTTPYFNTTDLLLQFKSHVWPHLEGTTGAIYHAHTTHLAKLDHLQDQFTKHINLTVEQAFIHYNFAPQRLRRDIAVLGFLHKCAHKQQHPDILHLFPTIPRLQYQARHQLRRPHHDKQLFRPTQRPTQRPTPQIHIRCRPYMEPPTTPRCRHYLHYNLSTPSHTLRKNQMPGR